MRNPASIAVLFLAVSLAPAAQAACEYPADVKIPDGKSATQDDISAASSAIKKYLADMEAYMACIDADAAALPVEEQTPEAKAFTSSATTPRLMPWKRRRTRSTSDCGPSRAPRRRPEEHLPARPGFPLRR
jgi:hypothetical protein